MEREILLLGNPALYEISEEVKEEELELLRDIWRERLAAEGKEFYR